MDSFFINVLIAMGVAVTPSATANFQILGVTEEFVVEIDMNSIAVAPKLGGYEVRTTIKRDMKQPVTVRGKKKEGSYYVEKTIVRCAQNTFTVEESTLYTKDSEILANGKVNQVYDNPKIPGNFVTDFIEILCSSAAKSKPSIVI